MNISVIEVLDILFIQPLMVIYAFLFELPPGDVGVGPRVVVFSILLNLALSPVYRQMELRGRAGRAIKEKVAREVARLKRHFRGRELYFYIRTAYRQHNYHPISELLGSADLFVQILVFATVYRYLHGLEALEGAAFAGIPDLSRPDALLGGVNLLPLLMTLINAAVVFLHVSDRAKRIQALALAGIFLVLLYGSPSGLVLYWTMNNLFSLVRNACAKYLVPRLPSSTRDSLAGLASQR